MDRNHPVIMKNKSNTIDIDKESIDDKSHNVDQKGLLKHKKAKKYLLDNNKRFNK